MKITRICANPRCCASFETTTANVKRGWGKFCSKSCKATVQEKRTNQYANYRKFGAESERDKIHRQAQSDCEEGWDGHKNAF